MNKIVLFSPFSQKLRNGNQNAKNYPYWQDLIVAMRRSGVIDEIWQLGVGNEYRYEGVTKHLFDKSFDEIQTYTNQSSVWLSVDNFLPHLCNAMGVRTKGIVLFSKSDPNIYGYPQNINLLKDRKYLRPDQFFIWEQCNFDADAFVDMPIVLNTILKLIEEKAK